MYEALEPAVMTECSNTNKKTLLPLLLPAQREEAHAAAINGSSSINCSVQKSLLKTRPRTAWPQSRAFSSSVAQVCVLYC